MLLSPWIWRRSHKPKRCDISTFLNWDLRSQRSWLVKVQDEGEEDMLLWFVVILHGLGASGSLVKPFLFRGPGTYHFSWSVARTHSCCNFTGLVPTTQLSKTKVDVAGYILQTHFGFLFEAGQILPFIGFHWGHTRHTWDPNRLLPKDSPRHGTSRWASVCATELGKQLKSMLFRVGSWWLHTWLNTII